MSGQVGGRASAPKGGKRDDLGGTYFRSTWEANVARLLNWWLELRQIESWAYECEEFTFPIARGHRHYLPDFKVTYPTGRYEWWEVKGYWDKASRVKVNRFKKYHPEEHARLVIIGPKEYREFAEWAPCIPGWEEGRDRPAPAAALAPAQAPLPFGLEREVRPTTGGAERKRR